MEISETYFLIAAQEKSISAAAARAYISQQAMSEQLNKLEKRCGVRLFERRPRLRLTPAGESLARHLRQIRREEEAAQLELEAYRASSRGHLQVGMHLTRAKALLPEVIPAFRQAYPQVMLSVTHGESGQLVQAVLEGTLDMALAVNTMSDARLRIQPICEMPVLLMASKTLLRAHLPGRTYDCGDELPFEELCRLPLLRSHPDSRVYQLTQRYFEARGQQPESLLRLSNSEAFYELVGAGCGACFFSEAMSGARMSEYNAAHGQELVWLRPQGLTGSCRFELVARADAADLPYALYFGQLLTQALAQRCQEERAFFA